MSLRGQGHGSHLLLPRGALCLTSPVAAIPHGHPAVGEQASLESSHHLHDPIFGGVASSVPKVVTISSHIILCQKQHWF